MSRAEWLEERRLGIGGSDCASLFNVGYGCRRRLWYDKRNVPADFPREESTLMRLGNALEPLLADIYEEKTGRTVCIEGEPFVSKDIPELRVNVDRTVSRASGDTFDFGLLEIKSVGRAVFYKYKREGLPEDYILQVQHGLTVTGFAFGAFAIGNRDNGDLTYWDVDRSDEICKEIATEAPLFWAQVENGPIPAALEPDDPRCGKCDWRVTCQGNALIQIQTGEMPQVQELAPLVEEYIQRKTLMDEAEELVEETKEELQTRLGERQAVYAGEHKVYYRPQEGRVTWDGKAMSGELERLRSLIATYLVSHPDDKHFGKDLPYSDIFKKQGRPFRTLKVY